MVSLDPSLPELVIEALTSHAQSLGRFDRVNQYEPKSAPGNNLSCSIWVQAIRPVSSGLISTSVRFDCAVRIYSDMLQEPQDMIDPNIYAAGWDLISAYQGDFRLDMVDVRSIDILGSDGEPMFAESGYIEIDKKMYRVMTLSVGVIINDAFSQES